MMISRNIVLIISLLALYGCSKLPKIDKVLPDKRTSYQKSRDMPSLEVPPDLTVTEGEYAVDIPGEESTSLSEFEARRSNNHGGVNTVLGAGEFDGEQWLALKGSSVDIWPRLHEFWKEKGYTIDLDDAELGVLETDWKEGEGDKHKFKIFTEPDESGGTILFMSSERQELSEGEWLDAGADTRLEKNVIRKLNLHFYGTEVGSTTSTASSSNNSSSSRSAAPESIKPKAEVLDVGEGKNYLAIPQEFTRAWRETKMVVERAGYLIESSDQEKGTYDIRYFKPEGKKEKKGLLSKLKFWDKDWGDWLDDEEANGALYQLSLTGVGEKTEVIVMNEKGEWEIGEDAEDILDTLRNMYNQL